MKEIKITDVKGIKIGNAQNFQGATGCTVILCEKGACGGVDVRGGGPATRETDLLNPVNMVDEIHGIMLSGGSSFGLESCSGAVKYLEERGIGLDYGLGVVPIVCGASLFDLKVGDHKCRPDKKMGYEACINAGSGLILEGNIGAGTGASVGKFLGDEFKMKGGLGTFCLQVDNLQVGAVAAVNALGDVVDVDTGEKIAGLLNEDKNKLLSTEKVMYESYSKTKKYFNENTTLGCIVTNAKLTKAQANKIASIAHDGLARAVKPVHTMGDGDVIFVMATGEVEAMPDAVGVLAAKVMGKAVNNALRKAEPAYGLKAANDFLNKGR